MTTPTFLQVSKLARFATCPKRAKIELFNKLSFKGYSENKVSAMAQGTVMHKTYSFPYKSLDRTILRSSITKFFPCIFFKYLTVNGKDYQIRGIYDDLKVNFDPITKVKTVSFIEVKTITRNKVYLYEVYSAIFQLQIYLWLYKDAITSLGWKYDQTHYVEFFNQASSNLLKRIEVEEHPDMGKMLTYVIKTFQGTAPFTYPPEYVCKTCPKSVKDHCSRWK